jgi:hypothetical protein
VTRECDITIESMSNTNPSYTSFKLFVEEGSDKLVGWNSVTGGIAGEMAQAQGIF